MTDTQDFAAIDEPTTAVPEDVLLDPENAQFTTADYVNGLKNTGPNLDEIEDLNLSPELVEIAQKYLAMRDPNRAWRELTGEEYVAYRDYAKRENMLRSRAAKAWKESRGR